MPLPRQLFHTTLRALLSLQPYVGRQLGHLTIAGPLPRALERLRSRLPSPYREAVALEWSHARMGLRALRHGAAEVWIVHEIYLQHASVLLTCLWLSRRDIFILLHGNKPLTHGDRLKRGGLALLNLFVRSPRFRIVLLELADDAVPVELQARTPRKVVLPFPARDDTRPSLLRGQRLPPTASPRVGVVGMLRPGKPLERLIAWLKAYASKRGSCQIVLGLPSWQRSPEIQRTGLTIVETDTEDQYLAALRDTHVLVVDFDAREYRNRPSAIVNDALSSGCYVVAPCLPVIARQIG